MSKVITTIMTVSLLSSTALAQPRPAAPLPPANNNNQQLNNQQQEDGRTKRARTAFSKRDANKDGFITIEEYLQTMSNRGQGTAPAGQVPNNPQMQPNR